ncbi:iron ABC transporter ATP-binding protein [Staphylococcus pettenkoferi]|uniref:ATP-binding cassette domain-containing protein n=1 Tax=Staphylococcus pettenkoferi TaxID=170573 RepID=A0ABT4BM83_9STAP|nr:ATP-binding cassette domain-containing protein [Staphylococcus pettenkoferi]MCI2804048.1 ATP-binding cassette domain-containing protein [Staphylococcus pettenkoferi]MCY1565115.1 ATP-binding cassette domain-containing protein [Staphylococcus pettenkoferi]MCY1571108.1 ATP-binding cassette domain-containing protein [Staphylococcus pettenkoferi]MCY1583739.1 ATP-binding cassette domain-containing protein [Staphylococcus pettenkoferi]MCY1589248.1 ATP-binding cassette domain-containing protein [St
MISVNNLTKTIEQRPILQDINVDIHKGQLTTIIGPNGAGKSTLLSAITRLTDYDQGTITIDEHSIDDYKSNDLAKKLSILKQTNITELNITVEQLVQFGRFPYSKGRLKKEDKEKIQEALSLLNLTEIKDRYIKTLSGGQRQRAYVAMTIAQDTEYILLDEPLNNLDMKHAVQIMQILRHLAHHYNKTIVVVIHDINFASCYSDHIIAIKDGQTFISDTKDKVVQAETLSQLYDMPVKVEEIASQRICIYYDEREESTQVEA